MTEHATGRARWARSSRSPGRAVQVTGGGLALLVDREALFGVLADRIELLQAMFSAVLRRQRSTVLV